jgi:hypothetical protein
MLQDQDHDRGSYKYPTLFHFILLPANASAARQKLRFVCIDRAECSGLIYLSPLIVHLIFRALIAAHH